LKQGPPAAVVILSAGRRTYAPEFGGETVDALGLERTRYGAHVARETGFPVLVSGGLATPDDPPLALLMADVLRDYGIVTKWQESRSSNTAENAIYSSGLLKQAGISRVLLVTHAWHMDRARAAFAANGMTVIPAPTAFHRGGRFGDFGGLVPSVEAFRVSRFALHERVGRVWYAIRYGY
jgi:uncharacterized SAM-binding protein YcdF (DUF218 family)